MRKGGKRIKKVFLFRKQLGQEMTDSTCHMELHSLASSWLCNPIWELEGLENVVPES